MVLIVGAGAVGTILAGYLDAAKQPVKLFTRAKDVDAFQHAQNLSVDRITGGPPLIGHKPGLTTSLEDLADVRYLIICVKYPALDEVLGSLPANLPPDLTLITTLNGVGAIRKIREHYPNQPSAVMTIMFNGQLLEPLHARITTKPQILIDTDDKQLLQLFNGSGMKVTRAAGEAAAWGKLLINLANAIGAVTHTTFKDLLTDPQLRQIFTATLDEATATLEAAGIRYELPVPLPYRAYRQLLLNGGPLPWWFAKLKNGLSDGSYPSMVADVDAGRPTEVRQLNGEIVSLGKQHGHATPINQRLCELVEAIGETDTPQFLSSSQLHQRLLPA